MLIRLTLLNGDEILVNTDHIIWAERGETMESDGVEPGTPCTRLHARPPGPDILVQEELGEVLSAQRNA